jgi:hypothetical protein
MKWWLKDYRKVDKKYPNIYREVSRHGHFFQVSSDYGDLSKMFKNPEDAVDWAKKRNKTKKFNIIEWEW